MVGSRSLDGMKHCTSHQIQAIAFKTWPIGLRVGEVKDKFLGEPRARLVALQSDGRRDSVNHAAEK